MKRGTVGTVVSLEAFHVVVSATGRVLDVFEESRLADAQESARQLQAIAALSTRVEQVRGRRPNVGEGFPWCDICAGEPTRREGVACFGCGGRSEMGS